MYQLRDVAGKPITPSHITKGDGYFYRLVIDYSVITKKLYIDFKHVVKKLNKNKKQIYQLILSSVSSSLNPKWVLHNDFLKSINYWYKTTVGHTSILLKRHYITKKRVVGQNLDAHKSVEKLVQVISPATVRLLHSRECWHLTKSYPKIAILNLTIP